MTKGNSDSEIVTRAPGTFARWWIDDRAHVIFWVITGIVAISSYLLVHMALRTSYQDNPTVRQLVSAAAGSYRVRESATTGEIELTVAGFPVEEAYGRAGPLSVGKLSATKGLLFDAVSITEDFNVRMTALMDGKTAHFRPEGAGPQTRYIANLTDLGLADAENLYIEVPGELNPRELERTLAGARLLRSLFQSAKITDRSARTSSASSAAAQIPRTATSKGVVKSLNQIVQDIPEPKLTFPRAAPEWNIRLADEFCKSLSTISTPLETFFQGTAKSAATPDCDSGFLVGLSSTEKSFRDRLVKLTVAESSFFWTYGRWLWWEIILLTWLGVITEGMVRLGNVYAKRTEDSVFEPRESVRTVTKFIAAPAISLVVIWTLMFTDIIDMSATTLDETGNASFVPLAFILGLFPNLGYRLLEDLALAIFGKTSMAKPRPRPKPETRHEPAAPVKPEGEMPDFEAMRARLKRHAVAPLRRGN